MVDKSLSGRRDPIVDDLDVVASSVGFVVSTGIIIFSVFLSVNTVPEMTVIVVFPISSTLACDSVVVASVISELVGARDEVVLAEVC